MIASGDILNYYDACGCMSTAEKMKWNTLIKNFSQQQGALIEQKKDISKTLDVIKWTEGFNY